MTSAANTASSTAATVPQERAGFEKHTTKKLRREIIRISLPKLVVPVASTLEADAAASERHLAVRNGNTMYFEVSPAGSHARSTHSPAFDVNPA